VEEDSIHALQNVEQCELADKLGIQACWEVEHHSWRSTATQRA
jgi:hypothetical protein